MVVCRTKNAKSGKAKNGKGYLRAGNLSIFSCRKKEMKNTPELIVMLTHHDRTVADAAEVFESCKNMPVRVWGMKEESLPFLQMKALYTYMKELGKTTALEVVAYSEKESLAGAKMTVECGCDILMGTVFSDSVNDFCKDNGLIYTPFVGKIKERPSVLEGTADEMIEEACRYIKKGVYGIDLLGYRYTGNALELNRRFVAEVNAPVCIAGDVNSFERLDEIKSYRPWSFTIGGAFFEHKFGGSFEEQIRTVLEYMEK